MTLLERQDELDALAALTERAARGRGQLCVVEGPSGIGKSALLDATRESLRGDDPLVLDARGSTLERDFPFGAILRLFEGVLRQADPAARERLLRDSAQMAAPLLQPGGAGGVSDDFQLIHGLYWFTVNLTEEQPVALFLDDLHWMDNLSLRFASYLAERIDDLPLAVIMSVRTGDPDSESALVTHLTSLPGALTLRPAPLTQTAVGVILGERVADLAPDDALVERAWRATGGNPFLLSELSGAVGREQLDGEGAAEAVMSFAPQTVRRRVLLRLTSLGADALALARAASIFPDGASFATVAAVAGLDAATAATAADRLRSADILENRSDGAIGFRHPMIRAAVHEELPAGSGVRLHSAAVAILHDVAAPADVIAHHLEQAWPPSAPWAQETLLSGGRLAAQKGAPSVGARYLRLALELAGPDAAPELLLDLGAMEAAAGDTAEALERFEAALARMADPLDKARGLQELGRVLYRHGRPTEAADAFRRGAALAAGGDHELALALEGGALCASYYVGTLQAETGERLDAVVAAAVAGGVNSPAERVLVAVASLHSALAMPPAAVAGVLASTALGDGELLRQRNMAQVAGTLATLALFYAGRSPEALETITTMRAEAHARGDGPAFAEASAVRALIALADGHVVAALADAQTAVDATWEGWRALGHCASATLAQCLLLRGDDAEAREVLRHAWEQLAPAESDGLNAWLYYARGQARLAESDGAGALEDFLTAGAALENYGVSNPAMLRWRGQAGIAAQLEGDTEQARALIEEEVELARAFDLPVEIGAALHARSVLETGAEREQTLTQAVELLESAGRPLDLAAALCDLGAAVRRRGARLASREPLTRALDLAERAGALALAGRAHDELLASGARPRRRLVSGIEALTPSQMRIAELAARGLSNRDIADRLFLAKSTVSWHLRHVYRKLEVNSREALEEMLLATSSSR